MSDDDLSRAIKIAEDIGKIKSQVSEMHRLLIGNGDPGMVKRVNDIELAMAKQVGLVAGASAVVSVMVSGVAWMLKR